MPTSDNDIVHVVENTSLIIVLRRDFEAEKVGGDILSRMSRCQETFRATTCVITHPPPPYPILLITYELGIYLLEVYEVISPTVTNVHAAPSPVHFLYSRY